MLNSTPRTLWLGLPSCGAGCRASVQVESEDEAQEREVSYCRVKVFRDKGSQRKNRQDHRHVEKFLEKYLHDTRDGVSTWAPGPHTAPLRAD